MATVPNKSIQKKPEPVIAADSAIIWEADSFVPYKHEASWYISLGLLGAAVITLAILFRHDLQVSLWLVIPVVVIACAVLVIRSVVKPHKMTYGINIKGVIIGESVVPFEQFRSYAVMRLENRDVIRLWPHQRYGFPTSIIIEQVDPKEINDILAEVLAQDQANHTLTDQISHILRF